MTGDGLRDELARIAGDAPVASVSPETWGRARRARLRDRALGVVGATAVVALAAGLGTLGLDHRDGEAPATSRAGLAVPDQVYDVPPHLLKRDADGSWSSGEVTDDLAVGVGALAFVLFEGLPVVVDADEGDYHLLDLPGFVGNDARIAGIGQEMALALAPDGRSLAYASAELGRDPDTDATPTAVSVVDLLTGDVRRIALPAGPDGRGVFVDRLVWSADGRWLAWHGTRIKTWGMGGGVVDPSGTAVAGRIAPGATTVELMDRSSAGQAAISRSLAIDDTGVVVATHGDEVLRWDDRALSTVKTADGTSLGRIVLTGDGRTIAAYQRDTGLRYVDTRTGRAVGQPRAGRAVPVAWVDDQVLAQTDEDRDGVDDSLVLVDSQGSSVVVRVDRNVGVSGTTVADDLLAGGVRSVDRSEPDWPLTRGERWSRAGLVVGLLALAALSLHLRRRREVTPGERPSRSSRFFGGLALGALVAAGISLASAFVDRDVPAPTGVMLAVTAAVAVTGVVGAFAGRSRAFWIGVVVGAPTGLFGLYVAVFIALLNSGALS